MKVLSLFDGMSCGQIALDQLDIPVEKYYASEIDKYAIKVTQNNFPNTIQVGDVCNLNAEDYKDVDLIQAGSPCQGFSFAGKQLAFDDPRSALFFEFIRLLKEIKPKYFLLENVRMKKEFLEVITDQLSQCYAPEDVDNQFLNVLGEVRFEPIFINSSLLSAQSRQRYYWTNIPGIKQPEDRGIVLRDILEDSFDSERDKAHCIDANYYKGASVEQYKKKHRRQLVNKPIKLAGEKGNHYGGGLFDTKGKSPTLNGIGNGGGGTNNIPKVLAKNKEQMIETKPKQVGVAVDIKGHDQIKRVYSPDGKSPTVTTCQGGHREPKVVTGGAFRARSKDEDGKHVDWKETKPKQMLELRKDQKSNAVSTVSKDSLVVNSYREVRTEEAKKPRKEIRLSTGKDHTPFRSKELVEREDGKVGTTTPSLNNDHKISLTKDITQDIYWRKLTPLECERLQTVPDNYTEGVSNTQRYKMLGNGWTVDVISHIFNHLTKE